MMAIYLKGVDLSSTDNGKTVVNNAHIGYIGDADYYFDDSTIANTDCYGGIGPGTFSLLSWYGHRGIFQWTAPAGSYACQAYHVTMTISPSVAYGTQMVVKTRDYNAGPYRGCPKYNWASKVRQPCWLYETDSRVFSRADTTSWVTFTGNSTSTNSQYTLGHHYGENGRRYPLTYGSVLVHQYEVWIYSIGGDVLAYDAIPSTFTCEVKFGE
jgi:hypothetical protein